MRQRGRWLLAGALGAILLGALIFEIVTTRSVRGAVRSFNELLAVANRTDLPDAERINIARSLCTDSYIRRHGVSLAAEGGIVGFPRMMHKNFKAWREGPYVWLCPSNRVGPVYQFAYEREGWKFDGLAGILREWGEFIPAPSVPGLDAPGE